MNAKQMESLRDHFESVYRKEFTIDEQIPERMKERLDAYVYERIRPGDFLMGVLTNDFSRAMGHADIDNLSIIKRYYYYIHNCMPSNCHGSPEAVEAWLDNKQNN